MCKPGDSFSGKGGGWDLYKCFFRDEEDGYGEFYINLNDKGEGEIVLKAIGYGDTLVKAFTKTFLPETEEDVKSVKVELVDWNKLTETLERLGENSSRDISRHAKGLIKALKL